jgi:hypothetical protein
MKTSLLLTASFALSFSLCALGNPIVAVDLGGEAPAAVMSANAPVLQSKPTPKQAIQDGLLWLARHQSPNGSWGAKALKERCPAGKACSPEHVEFLFTDHYDEGLTGLAVLSFLRAGYGPESKFEFADSSSPQRYKTGEVVTRALEWLVKDQNDEGAFEHERAFMYNQAIATLALCEAARVSKNEAWKNSAKRGVAFIVKAQRPNPAGDGLWGWRYSPRGEIEEYVALLPKDDPARNELSDADPSVTGWCTAALTVGAELGFEVKKDVLDGAIAFCDFVSAVDGRVGYQLKEQAGIKVTGPNDKYDYHTAVLSALVVAIRMDANKDRKHAFFELALQQVLADQPTLSSDHLSIDYYYWYHGSVALNRFDADSGNKTRKKTAGPWNKSLTQILIDLQERTKGTCAYGGWTAEDRWSYAGGAVYCTAMSVLALEACNPK